VRLVDLLVRQGHLSERALTEAVLTGARPRHMERCEVCGDRAVELGRWLVDLKDVAVAEADEAFPAERLAVQQSQIMRRLEQSDEPARVIEFPTSSGRLARDSGGRRVAPAWLGVAAAAGVVVGVIGGHLTTTTRPTDVEARKPQVVAPRPQQAAPPTAPAAVQPQAAAAPQVAQTQPNPAGEGSSVLSMDLEEFMPDTLRVADQATPRLVSYTVSRR
jgi:hypothetical protein